MQKTDTIEIPQLEWAAMTPAIARSALRDAKKLAGKASLLFCLDKIDQCTLYSALEHQEDLEVYLKNEEKPCAQN